MFGNEYFEVILYKSDLYKNDIIKMFYKMERISRTKFDGFTMIFEQIWKMKIIIDLKVLVNISVK